jgi:hypothetical protein
MIGGVLLVIGFVAVVAVIIWLVVRSKRTRA